MAFCSNCGTELAASARFCPSCGAQVNTATAPPEAGEAPRPAAGEAAAAAQMEYASLASRILAHVVDGVIVLIAYFIIGYVVAATTGNLTDDGFSMEGGPALLAIVLTFVVSMLYFAVLESSHSGKTLGKKLLVIRVADAQGGPAGFGQALNRNLLRIVDGLVLYVVGLVLAWRSPRNQRLGDRVARTVVVKAAAAPKPAASAGARKKGGIRFSMGRSSGADYID